DAPDDARRAVDAAEGRAPRRIVLDDLVRRPVRPPAGYAAPVRRAGADTRRSLRLDFDCLDRLLPLAVPREVVDVREDVRLAAADFEARDDWRHGAIVSPAAGAVKSAAQTDRVEVVRLHLVDPAEQLVEVVVLGVEVPAGERVVPPGGELAHE